MDYPFLWGVALSFVGTSALYVFVPSFYDWVRKALGKG